MPLHQVEWDEFDHNEFEMHGDRTMRMTRGAASERFKPGEDYAIDTLNPEPDDGW